MINLAGPTTAITTGTLSAATYTFTSDLAMDSISRAYAVTTVGGTQVGVTTSTAEKPKQVIFKRPAQFKSPTAYNSHSNRYGVVPKNHTRVIGRMGVGLTAVQTEVMGIELNIGVPAGSVSYDEVNVRAGIAAFIGALWDQKEEVIQAVVDGLY